MDKAIKNRIAQINGGEIPQGYVKTPFGIFPHEWTIDKTFGDLFDYYGGLSKSREELGDVGYPYLHYGDLHINPNTVAFQIKYLDMPKYDCDINGNETFLMQDGDVAFLDASEDLEGTSRAVLIDNPDNKPFIAGLHIINGRSKDDSLHKWYKQYITTPQYIKKQFQRLAVGFKVYGINKYTLPKIQVAFPKSNLEQSKIAEILMKWDEAIKLQEQYLIKIKQRKQYYLNSIFSNHSYENFAFSQLYIRAGEGGTPDTKKFEYYDNKDIPFVKIEHLANKYITKIDSYISLLGLENSGAWIVPENSLIFSNGASIGEASINTIPVATKQGILGIVPSQMINVEYFYYLVKSHYFLSKIKKITTKGTMYTAYLKDIDNLKFFIHDIQHQRLIANSLSGIDKIIELEEDKMCLLKLQRKVLQQYLLTGIVRV